MASKTLTVKLKADINNFQKEMDKVNSKMKDIGKGMKDYGARIGTSFGLAATAVSGGLGFAVKKSMDFNAEMSKVGAIAGASKSDLDKLKDSALELGSKTSLSASEVAQGMELMAAMGFTTNDIIGAMPGVISAAEASGEDLALVSDVVASALNNFGLKASDASKVADILALTANKSAAGIGDMQYAFKYAAPVASQLGIGLEDLAAATGIMANAGIGGSTAGTTLRSALLNLVSPTKQQKDLMADLGLKFTDAQGKMLPFPDIIGKLQGSLKGMTQSQKAAALSTLFGTDAVSGMMTLVDAGPEKLKNFSNELKNSGGASAEAAGKMKDNLKGALDELGGAFESAQISIGNALTPAIEKVTGALQGLFDWFNNLSPQGQKMVAMALAVTAGLLGLVAIVGVLVMVLGALATAEWAVLLPIIGIVAGIAALVAIFILAYAKLDWFREGVNTLFNFIGSIAKTVLGAVVTFIKEQLDKIQAWWKVHGEQIMTFLQIMWTVISTIFKVAFYIISNIVQVAWSLIKGIFSGAIDIILGIVGFFADLFTGNWDNLWNDIKQIFNGVWEIIKTIFGSTVGRLFKILWDFGGKVIGWITGWVGDVVQWFVNLGSKITGAMKQAWDWVKQKIIDFILWANQSIASWHDTLIDKFWAIVDGITGVFGNLFHIITKPFADAWDFIKGIPGKIKEAFKNLILKIPTPKLPHVSVNIKHKSILGVDIPYPDFDIDWRKKGGLFKGASVIGIGEQPGVKEAAMPLSGRHMKPFADAVANQMPDKGEKVIVVQNPIYLDGRLISVATTEYTGKNMQQIKQTKKRSSGGGKNFTKPTTI